MGEIAEGYLDGTFCQSCGELLIDFDADDELDREPQGFPGFCEACAPEEDFGLYGDDDRYPQ